MELTCPTYVSRCAHHLRVPAVVYCVGSAVAFVRDVRFLDNMVSGAVDWRAYNMGIAGGGALLLFGSDVSGGASVRVQDCTFVNNTVNATDLFPAASDSSGQGSLTKGRVMWFC
jgi:hypothetical protein